MNATLESKQQERLDYCVEHLSIEIDGFGMFAKVSSASDRKNKSYRVDIDETSASPKAKHCSCPASKENCVHYQAVNIVLGVEEEQEVVPEQIVVVTPEVELQVQRCGGCGCDLATSKNCTANFCLWNSFYTEGLRLQEDQRLKQTAQQEEVEEVAEPVATTDGEFHVHLICPGCGGVYGRSKEDKCALGFCYWNSFWTEARRKEQDELAKHRDEFRKGNIHNNFSWQVAS